MKIHLNDKVKIMSGKDKSKESVVIKVLSKTNLIVVKDVNVVSKHLKQSGKDGGIIKMSKPVNASNVMLICPKCKKPARVGYKLASGRKYRYCKKCKEVIRDKKDK